MLIMSKTVIIINKHYSALCAERVFTVAGAVINGVTDAAQRELK